VDVVVTGFHLLAGSIALLSGIGAFIYRKGGAATEFADRAPVFNERGRGMSRSAFDRD
jgi:hypothetical protein